MPSYYDIDDILAEEEAVPCLTLFDFSHLAHLHPDHANASGHRNSLPENSKIKMPLWAIRKWAELGFCRLLLPTHYRTRARELIQADPASVTLRPRFFHSGHAIVNVMESSAQENAKILAKQPASAERNAQLQYLEAGLQEARQLRETLLQTYTGPRLSQTLDWALSSVGDDVTAFLCKLSDMEKRLYQQAALTAVSHETWKLYRNRRLMPQPPSSSAVSSKRNHNSTVARTVSPSEESDHRNARNNEKRARVGR